MQVLRLVRISKNTNYTVLKTEGVKFMGREPFFHCGDANK